jgi:hypothetical protein
MVAAVLLVLLAATMALTALGDVSTSASLEAITSAVRSPGKLGRSQSSSSVREFECPALVSSTSASHSGCLGDCLADMLRQVSAEDFMHQYWDTKMLVVQGEGLTNQSEVHEFRQRFGGFGGDSSEFVDKYVSLFEEQGKVTKYIDIRNHGDKQRPLSSEAGLKEAHEAVANGSTLVMRFEFVTLPANDPLECLADTLSRQFGLPTTVHAYISGRSDQALDPHTDPYDTIILHLFGKKHWKVSHNLYTESASCSASAIVDYDAPTLCCSCLRYIVARCRG